MIPKKAQLSRGQSRWKTRAEQTKFEPRGRAEGKNRDRCVSLAQSKARQKTTDKSHPPGETRSEFSPKQPRKKSQARRRGGARRQGGGERGRGTRACEHHASLYTSPAAFGSSSSLVPHTMFPRSHLPKTLTSPAPPRNTTQVQQQQQQQQQRPTTSPAEAKKTRNKRKPGPHHLQKVRYTNGFFPLP